MKKKRIFLLPLLLLLGLLCACGSAPPGDISSVERTIPADAMYTEEEIADAMEEVERKFARDFKGCTLLNLRYDEEKSITETGNWAQEADEALVLLSDFHVSAKCEDGGLSKGDYTDWSWILLRNNAGSWTLRTWGYG